MKTILLGMFAFLFTSLHCLAGNTDAIFYKYPNSGINFEALFVIPTNGAACVGDFNEDGFPDIIAMGPNYNDFNRNLVNLLVNNKDGSFTRHVLRIPGRSNGSISYTRIGTKHFLLSVQGGTAPLAFDTNASGYVAELSYIGDQFNCRKLQELDNGLINGDILFLDFDSDSFQDIIQFGGNREVYTYRNNGKNQFELVTNVSGLQGAMKGECKLADMDNDGKQDIVCIDETNGLCIYRNVGKNEFTPVKLSTDTYPFKKEPRLALGDLNKDGKLDIIAFDTNLQTGENAVILFYGKGNLDFSETSLKDFNGVRAAAAAISDFNNDGYPDILYSGENSRTDKNAPVTSLTKKVYLLTGDGNKGFVQHVKTTPEKQDCDIFSLSPVGNGKYHIADFDGDGKPDVFALGELGIQIPGKNMNRACLFLSSLTSDFGTPVQTTRVERSWQGFPYHQVRLEESNFTKAMNKEIAYIKSLDMNRLFASSLKYNQGDDRYALYGGWESGGNGIAFAHYLSGLSMGYAATGDRELLDRANRCVEIIKQGQERMGDGLFSFSEGTTHSFNKMAKDKIIVLNAYDENGHPWGNNDVGFPFYNQHKIFAGLRDAYIYAGNEDARVCFLKQCDWLVSWMQNFDKQNMQLILESEHGGIVEILSDGYALSGKQKYLDAALKFTRENFAQAMSDNIDDLSGRHSNFHIPMAVGASVHYLYSGDERSHRIAHNFFHIVHDHHTLCNGGTSANERFGTPDLLTYRLLTKGPESCCTYNMLKLSKNLFCLESDPAYLDYYENALYNHMLGTISPSSHAGVCYYTSLKSGAFKMYDNLYDNFWCCVSSGMESHVKYVDAIYFKSQDGLLVNLFTPSVLNWTEKGLKLKTVTNFPVTNDILLKIEENTSFDQNIFIRYPKWAEESSVLVKINGVKQSIKAKPGELISLSSVWKANDEILITIPCTYRLVDLPDDLNVSAIFYGPLLLAAEMGATGQNDVGNNDTYQVIGNPTPDLYFPSLKIGRDNLTRSIVKSTGRLLFKTKGLERNYNMIPFYEMHHSRYSIYWKLGDEDDLAKERMLIPDRVIPASPESEQNHHVVYANSNSGMGYFPSWFGPSYYWYRDAMPDGFISYELSLLPTTLPDDKQYHLQLTYYGTEAEGHGNFTIYVDNEEVAKVASIANLAPLDFAQRYYPIPRELTDGKKKITVKLANGRPSVYGVKLTTTADLLQAIREEQTTSLPKPVTVENTLSAWYNENRLHIVSYPGNSYQLYDTTGQLIKTMTCKEAHSEFSIHLTEGVYLLQAYGSGMASSCKVMVTNK